ncbi:MAG: diguanylate cyclase [Thiotrichaceae bacterium]|nr:diguanylate cyclase [Thiotrichaceae bacterium]
MSKVNKPLSDESKAADEVVVLLVDDQQMVAEAIRRMLADEPNITFHYCSDPKKAVEMAAEIAPTTILQDLVMPDIDGMTLLRAYRNHPVLNNTPVIVLSSKEDPKDKCEAFSCGASDYLVKLPDKIELIARIKAHSRSYVAQQQRDAAFRELHELQKELEIKNVELQRLSAIDGLTGIPNRRSFDEYIAKEWRRAVREGTCLALLLIDIDFFKKYNDGYGHQGGDDCLQKVAQVLADTMRRSSDMVARYGGEEFTVVLPNTDLDGAMVIAEELRLAVEKLALKHAFSDVTDIVSISLGAAGIPPQCGDDCASLIALADAALYKAKEEGRNRCCRENRDGVD